MSAARYQRLVAYLNSPEHATLWEHRRLSNPYLWGRDTPREPVRSVTSLEARLAKLFKVRRFVGPLRAPIEADALKARSAIAISVGLSDRHLLDRSGDFTARVADQLGRFFRVWLRREAVSYAQPGGFSRPDGFGFGRFNPVSGGINAIAMIFENHAVEAIERKRFPTKCAFYSELWHRLKSTFAFRDAPWCEFEDLPPEFSALIRTRNVSADATDQLRMAIDRSNGERGSLALHVGAVQHEVFAQASEGWSTIDIPGLQGEEWDVEIIDEGPVAGELSHIEEFGFEVD